MQRSRGGGRFRCERPVIAVTPHTSTAIALRLRKRAVMHANAAGV
ncbi:hypothetical protein [Azospirillum sp. B21]|nr:hypothetical protein [Azospirillum sp. B21]